MTTELGISAIYQKSCLKIENQYNCASDDTGKYYNNAKMNGMKISNNNNSSDDTGDTTNYNDNCMESGNYNFITCIYNINLEGSFRREDGQSLLPLNRIKIRYYNMYSLFQQKDILILLTPNWSIIEERGWYINAGYISLWGSGIVTLEHLSLQTSGC